MEIKITKRQAEKPLPHNVYAVWRNGKLYRAFDELSDDYARLNAKQLADELEASLYT